MSKDTLKNLIIQTKLVKLTCREIIGIFTTYQFWLWYCTFWLFAPKWSLLFTYVSLVVPKMLLSPIACHNLKHVELWEVVSMMW
jgi:hypothetical protein